MLDFDVQTALIDLFLNLMDKLRCGLSRSLNIWPELEVGQS